MIDVDQRIIRANTHETWRLAADLELFSDLECIEIVGLGITTIEIPHKHSLIVSSMKESHVQCHPI